MQQELGIVISTPDSPSTTKICFVCIDKPVHKGQYVQIKYIEGTLIGLVTDIIKINRYFENQDSIKEFENNSVNIFDQFPIPQRVPGIRNRKPKIEEDTGKTGFHGDP